MGGVLRVVVDGVVGDEHPAISAEKLTGVRVHIKPREVAARDIDPYPVALLENIGRWEGF